MIVKSLVDDSETVDVREVEQRNGTTLIEVRVAPERRRKDHRQAGTNDTCSAITRADRRSEKESALPSGNC